MTISDTIGMRYRDAKRLGLSWGSHVPIIDPGTLRIDGILDTESDMSAFRLVEVFEGIVIVPNGMDAAVRRQTGMLT